MKLVSLLKPSAYKARLLRWAREQEPQPSHKSGDGMVLHGRALGFLSDPAFLRAYERGMNSGHHIARAVGSTDDLHIEYRVYVECWAASQGLLIEGDFVTCGVNTGVMPLAICEYLDFNKTGRRFYLFDTYNGIPETQMSDGERQRGLEENAAYYSDCYDLARENFAPYPNAKLVRGMVPDTLNDVQIDKVAYLAIDMNIAYPERKAIEFFWPKLTPGALIVLDDYGFSAFVGQRASMDEFAASVGVSVLTLPTGQGLIKKP